MARYRLATIGVYDNDNAGALILPNYPGWSEYETWLASGGVPDSAQLEPLPALAERRLRVVRRTEELMRIALTKPFHQGGVQFAFDHFDTQTLVAVWMDSPLPTGFAWRDVAGTMHAMNHAQLAALVHAVAARRYALTLKRWQIEAAINASADPESINPDQYDGI